MCVIKVRLHKAETPNSFPTLAVIQRMSVAVNLEGQKVILEYDRRESSTERCVWVDGRQTGSTSCNPARCSVITSVSVGRLEMVFNGWLDVVSHCSCLAVT